MKKNKMLCILLTVTIPLLLLCACGSSPKTKKSVVILDSDFGTDDAIALLLAGNTSRDIFDYIVASQGNTSLDNAVKNAIILKAYLGVDATIVQGIPLSADKNVNEEEAYTFHGSDGIGNMQATLEKSLGITKEQLDDYIKFDKLAEELAKVDEIIYITIGPTSNLANLIDNEKIKSKISAVYMMGGGINEFNCEHNTEYNFSADPESVKKILDSGLNITLFPLDLTNHQVISSDMIEDFKKGGAFPEFIEFLKFNLQSNESMNNNPLVEMHDSIPVLYHISPELFQLKDMKITVDEYGSTKLSDDGALLHVATGVEDSLPKLLKDIFSKTGESERKN